MAKAKSAVPNGFHTITPQLLLEPVDLVSIQVEAQRLQNVATRIARQIDVGLRAFDLLQGVVDRGQQRLSRVLGAPGSVYAAAF